MGTWKSPLITEASGLAFSRKWAGIAYVINDENGPIYIVNWSTGQLVGSISIKNRSTVDPESLSIDVTGILTLADCGDNEPSSRSSIFIYTIREPGPGFHGAQSFVRWELGYPGGASHNAETFLDRANGNKYVISKVAQGVVYRLPDPLKRGVLNPMKAFHGPDPDLDYVSDAVGQWDDQWTFTIHKDHNSAISVFDRKWVKQDEIAMPEMVKPEGLAIVKDGRSLGVCDDTGGTGGHYQTVKIPKDFWPVTKPHTPPPPPPPTPPVTPCSA